MHSCDPHTGYRALVRAGILALLAPLLVACGDADGLPDNYFPTEPGMRWAYHLTRTTMDGTRVQPYYVEHRGPALIRGWTEPLEERRTFDGNRYFYQRTPADGWMRMAVQSAADADPRPLAEPWRVLPARIAVGEVWRQTTPVRVLERTGPPQETLFRVQASLPANYRIVAIDDRVEVPAGVFTRCLRIEGKGSISMHLGNYLGLGSVELHSIEWYAPGVGLVRQSLRERTNRQALDRGEMLLELTGVTAP